MKSPTVVLLLDVVEELVCLNEPKSCDDGSVVTGRVSHVEQVKGEGPDQASHKPAALRVHWRQENQTRKKNACRNQMY